MFSGKIEDQMLSRKRAATPLTPVIPEAHDKYRFNFYQKLSKHGKCKISGFLTEDSPMTPSILKFTEPSRPELPESLKLNLPSVSQLSTINFNNNIP